MVIYMITCFLKFFSPNYTFLLALISQVVYSINKERYSSD